MTEMPYLDNSKCNGCGLCVSVCARYALMLSENTIRFVETVECDWCKQCELVCPTSAVTFPFEVVIEE